MFNLDEIYSVSEFLSLCNKTVEKNIPTCWLQGEISNLSRPASGHWYFSLKDNKGQIRCALFRLSQRNINFNPENGMEVLVRAAPTLYEARGDFQLIVQKLEPVGTGNLQLAFDQLKNKLRSEGLFDPIHKKTLPSIVNTIGIVSSSSGAVIKDICKILNKRYPFAEILLFDCVVQGSGSAKKLANAISIADNSKICDVLIIARGGGSLEDLWAFNEELVARSIFKANTPIISAIGHETDTTIADFVSDIRAPTPSAAAVIATPDRMELISNVNKLLLRLINSSNQIIDTHSSKLIGLIQRIPTPSRQINYYSQKLDNASSYLNYQLKTSLSLNNSILSNIFEKLKQHSPSSSIQYKKEKNAISKQQLLQQVKRLKINSAIELNNINDRLVKSIEKTILLKKHKLSSYANSLNHLSPLNTLSRGYSITSDSNKKVLLSKSNINIKDSIVTQLSDGKVHSVVSKIENN